MQFWSWITNWYWPVSVSVIALSVADTVVTTKVDGKWYVSPVRSYYELALTLFRGFEPKDVDALIELLKK